MGGIRAIRRRCSCKASAVTSAVKKLRESLSTGGFLIVSVTESAAQSRSKAGSPPVWSEVTGLALLAQTESDTQPSVWFSAKQVTSSKAIQEILSDSRLPKVGYDLKRQVVALSRLGVELVGFQFDPLIAGHLLDAGQRNQGLADLLARFADMDSSITHIQDAPQTAEQAASSCHSVASLVGILSKEIEMGGSVLSFPTWSCPWRKSCLAWRVGASA